MATPPEFRCPACHQLLPIADEHPTYCPHCGAVAFLKGTAANRHARRKYVAEHRHKKPENNRPKRRRRKP